MYLPGTLQFHTGGATTAVHMAASLVGVCDVDRVCFVVSMFFFCVKSVVFFSFVSCDKTRTMTMSCLVSTAAVYKYLMLYNVILPVVLLYYTAV